MRIPLGVVDQYVYFYAGDTTDVTIPETGLTGFTVYYSRDGAVSVAMTTPTTVEVDATNQPGIYALLVDEADMVDLGSGNDNEVVSVTVSHASMEDAYGGYEVYRRTVTSGNTLGVESDGDATKVNTLNGHTAQTADHTAGIATIDTELGAVQTDVDDIQTRLPAALVGGKMDSDMTSVSGDSGAADNMEATYDGTGYTDDAAPSTQQQVGGLAVGTGGIALQAESYTLTTGTQSSGTITDAETIDDVTHQHTDTAGVMELYYQFDVGGNGIGAVVDVHGRINGNNDDLTVYAYNWDGASWDALGVFAGQASSTNVPREYKIARRNTGTGANLGKVRIRFYAASGLTSATLHVDRILLSKSVVTESVGYALGRVWLDTVGGTAGTVAFVNGVADKHSLTIADVFTLLASVGLKDTHVINGSTVVLGATVDNQSFFGDNWILDLDGRSATNAYFQGASSVSGICTASSEVHFEGCDFTTASIQLGHFDFCGFAGTITQTLAGDYNYHNCYSKFAGPGAPTFAKTAGQTITGEWRWWSGSMTLTGIEAGDVFTISGELGTITLEGAEGTVEIRGTYKSIVDNRTGSPTLNLDGAIKGSDVADILVDTGTTLPTEHAATDVLIGDVPTVAEFNARSDRNAALIESDRGEHTWQGNLYYVAPNTGDTHANGNRGGRTDPYNSVQDCHDNAVTSSNHDVIILVADAVGSPTTLDEDVTISKNYVLIRGPGRDFLWTNTANTNDTVTVTGVGVELAGFRVSTNTTGSPDGIAVTDDHSRIRDLWLDNCRTDGIHLAGASFCVLDNILAHDGGNSAGDSAVRITGASDNVQVLNTRIRAQTGSGIVINSTGEHATIDNCLIDECSKYGVEIVAGDSTMLRRNMWHDNTLGDFIDGGTDTHFENNEQWAKQAKSLAYTRLLARSDGFVDIDDAVELAEINSDGGSGSGDYDPEAHSQEAIVAGQGLETTWAS